MHEWENRFWIKVEKKENGCWEWIAGKSNGYGRFRLNGKTELAHKLSYELKNGKVPDSLDLDHLCRIRWCVNPEHLEAVTRLTNIQRGDTGAHNRNKTHCDNGHLLDGTQWDGERYCRTCKKLNTRRWRENKEATENA